MQTERPGPQGDQPGEREPAQWSTSNEATAPDADAYRRRYLELFNGANDIIYTHDLDGVFTSVNAAGLRATGRRAVADTGISNGCLRALSWRACRGGESR